MALELALETTQFGVPAPKAYARITNFFGTKDNIQVLPLIDMHTVTQPHAYPQAPDRM